MNELEQIKKDLISDKDLLDFIKKNNISDDDLLSVFPQLLLYKEGIEKCKMCQGKKLCESEVENMYPTLSFIDGKTILKYKACPRIKAYNAGNLKVLFINEETINQEVYLTDGRASVMKDLVRFQNEYKKGKKTRGTYIYGPCGSGKTFVLFNFAKKLIADGCDVIFAYYPDLARQIKSAIGNNIEEIIAELKKVEILMLDDIGAENNTPFIRDDVLGPILQYRMDNYLPVFMTSNQSIDLLDKHFMETYNDSDRLKSTRIIERITCLMNDVELNDKNYRK